MKKPEVDVDAVIREFQQHPGSTCIFVKMPDEARDFANVLLADKRVMGATIVRALLARYGIHLNRETIRRHRDGICMCGR